MATFVYYNMRQVKNYLYSCFSAIFSACLFQPILHLSKTPCIFADIPPPERELFLFFLKEEIVNQASEYANLPYGCTAQPVEEARLEFKTMELKSLEKYDRHSKS